jgi:hypothetical protein
MLFNPSGLHGRIESPQLTSSATSLNIVRAKTAGLVEHEPLRPPPEWKRHILCPPEIDAQLAGRDPKHGLPAIAVSTVIGRFIAGHSLSVSRKKRHGKWRKLDVDLERLEGLDEIWVLCYRHPRPGWRIAGRFLEVDVIALFRIYDKRDIGNDYEPVGVDVALDWTRYFGTQPPCSGDWISGYLSGSHFDVDEKT